MGDEATGDMEDKEGGGQAAMAAFFPVRGLETCAACCVELCRRLVTPRLRKQSFRMTLVSC